MAWNRAEYIQSPEMFEFFNARYMSRLTIYRVPYPAQVGLYDPRMIAQLLCDM